MANAQRYLLVLLSAWVSLSLSGRAVPPPVGSSENCETVALWLFDESEYLNATLTDATQNFYDLRLFPAGKLVPGRFGSAITRRSPAPGQAVSFAEDCTTFDNDWEGSLKDRPAKAPTQLIDALQHNDFALFLCLFGGRGP
jgi:hypothetical protein